MKKVLIILSALLLCTAAFSESLFDYIPKTSTILNGTYGLTVKTHFWRDSADYTITIKNGEAGILALAGHKDFVEFYVRTRSSTTNGPIKFYYIRVNSASTIQVTPLDSLPSLQGFYLFEGLTNDNLINFRDAPAISGSKIGQYQKNNIIPFTGNLASLSSIDNAEDYWYSFDYNGKPAWIYGKYISFPSEVNVTSDMFSTPQVFNTPSVTARKNSTTGTDEIPISGMNFTTARLDSLQTETSTQTKSTRIYDTGVSTVILENDRKGGRLTTTVTISKDDIVIGKILCPIGAHHYIPETAQFFYTEYYSGAQYILNGINCKDGTNITLPAQGTQQNFYIHTSGIQVNKTGDKIMYQPYPHDYNKLSYTFMILDLKTMTTTEYTLNDRWLNISFFHWLNDTSFFLAESVTWDDITGNVKYIFSYITIEDGEAVVKQTFSLPEQYENTCYVLSQGDDDSLTVRIDNQIWILDSSGTSFVQLFTTNGSFINTFTYCEKEYYAVVENENGLVFDAVIYDTEMNEIKRQTLTKDREPDMIKSIGVRNGIITVSLELVK